VVAHLLAFAAVFVCAVVAGFVWGYFLERDLEQRERRND
jgi:hypothetical protein